MDSGSYDYFIHQNLLINIIENLISMLILFGHIIKLGQCKDRTVLANIFFADVAPAAYPDTAFHAHLKREISVFRQEAELFEGGYREFEHNRRAADEADGVLR